MHRALPARPFVRAGSVSLVPLGASRTFICFHGCRAASYADKMFRRVKRTYPGNFIAACAMLLCDSQPILGDAQHILAQPAEMIETAERIDFVGQNSFTKEASEFGQVLRSTPHRSASGLYLHVHVPPGSLRPVTWHWRVDQLQPSADIRALRTEDFGAVIFFIFGEPSLFNRDVPTLAYTWTATPVANGTLLPSLRYQSLRFVQLRGRAEVGTWQRERRDLAADYRMVFGNEPPALRYVAVFNDNDQTSEPASALFGPIEWVSSIR